MRLFTAVGAAVAATALAVAPLTPAMSAPAAAATPDVCAEGTTPLQLLTFNDFHGRVQTYKDRTVRFFGAVEEARAAFGEKNTLFTSAGDNWGGSLFTSAVADEKPSIDVLNAADLEVTAVGNHEFDRGWTFLQNINDTAEFPVLGANVYRKGTRTPAMPEYTIVDVNGTKVLFVGVVTATTATMVSPDGIADIEFGPMAEAVNRVVAAHKDEADVVVASFHEGTYAGQGASTWEQQMAEDKVFQEINSVTADVDVIFNGHTHQSYAWTGTKDGKQRPVMQAKQYGEKLGQVVLCMGADKKIASFHSDILNPSSTPVDQLVSSFPRVAKIKEITEAAVKNADVIGAVEISCASAPLSRGKRVDGGEDRGVESTMTNAVANMFRDQISGITGKKVIGVQNPGGTRADLDEGPITYKEAADILPFANMLQYAELTGAEFKTLLEQQWQPEGASRAFLHLGLSDNVHWTYDPERPKGDRVTGIWVDGQPVDADASYLFGSGNFLLAGGDNFTVFADKAKTDTGLVDLDAWTTWLKGQADECLAPSFVKKGIVVSPTPATIGRDAVTVQVRELDFTSTGAPKNTHLMAVAHGLPYTAVVGHTQVTDGAATLVLRNRWGMTGERALQIVAMPTGTSLELPVTLTRR